MLSPSPEVAPCRVSPVPFPTAEHINFVAPAKYRALESSRTSLHRLAQGVDYSAHGFAGSPDDAPNKTGDASEETAAFGAVFGVVIFRRHFGVVLQVLLALVVGYENGSSASLE